MAVGSISCPLFRRWLLGPHKQKKTDDSCGLFYSFVLGLSTRTLGRLPPSIDSISSLLHPSFLFLNDTDRAQVIEARCRVLPMTLGSYSIFEAALALERRRGQQEPSTSTTKSASLGPVDVVAVVSGIVTLQSPPAVSVAATPRVDLRIADQSIPNDTAAKVSLYGSQEVARISEEQIAPGDVIRFNRIGLSRRYRHRKIDQSMARSTVDDNTIHFEHDPADPEPGWRWYKLGRIRTAYFDDQHDHHERKIPISATRKAFLTEDDRHSRNFPEEMATAESRIQELIAWFLSRERDDDADISPGPEGNSRTPGRKEVIACGTHRNLSPLPCKRRSLAEIQASSGLLSNIHVQVTHCDSQVLPPSSSASTSASKRRRVGTAKRPQQQQQQVYGFATVADDSGVVLSLVDPGNRFGSFFQSAQDQGKVLMMSNVLSKKQSDIYGRPLVSEEVVLWPTRTTSASILSSTLPDGDEKAPVVQRQGSPHSRLSRGAQSDKRRIHGGKGEEEISQTQLSQRYPTFHTGYNDPSSNYVLVESRVVDISINETSLRRCVNGTLQDLKNNVISADGMGYMPATVHLETNGGLQGMEQAKTKDTFLAADSVFQALCGGVLPSEWHIHEVAGEQGGSTSESKTTTVGWKVLQLLRALFYEGVPLRWTIDVGHDPPRVIKVSLPRV
jgi:hypothetical protein